jgi:hypothetical protein
MFVPAATAAAAANGKSDAQHTAVLAASKQATPAAAASARAASATPRGAVAAPPRMQIGSEPEAAGATAAAGGGVRRIAGNPQSQISLPVFDDEPARGGRLSGRVLPLLIGGIAVAVIIAGLIVITNAGGGTTAGNVNHNNSGQTGQSLHNRKPGSSVPFTASKVTVAVLNGTAQSGLAGAVSGKLARDGYKKGNITNAASQTQASTAVYYVTGKSTVANRVAAKHVAKALALPPSRVHKAGHTVLQSCTISATGASLGSCSADVIVSVGQDRANLGSSG